MNQRYKITIYTLEKPEGIELEVYATHLLDIDINKEWERSKEHLKWGDLLVGVCIQNQEIGEN